MRHLERKGHREPRTGNHEDAVDNIREHEIEIEATPQEVLGAVGEAADEWGAQWERSGSGGQLCLPVNAGLRHGLLKGELLTKSRSKSSRVIFREEESRYSLHLPTFVVILMGGMGGLATLILPFYPQLLGLLPGAVLLVLVAWFLVVSRVKYRGPAEFLTMVAELHKGNPPSRSGLGRR